MVEMRILLARRSFAAVAVLLAVCASSLSAADKPATYTVNIAQMRYGAVPDDLKVGDTIIWINKDTVPHTVTAKSHSFDIRIPPGKQVPQTLGDAGSFPFYCIYHSTMRGTLKVAAN